MDGQPIICIQSPAFSLHIFRIHHSPELSGSAADKDVSQENLRPGFGQQKDADGAASHIHLLYAQVQTALSVPCLQLYKAYILSLFFSFIFINIGNQSAIVRHIFTPLLYSI